MANEERLQALAERLTEATNNRKLRWTVAGTDRFQLSLPNGAIVVDKVEGAFPGMYVYDDAGNHIESLEESSLPAAWDQTLRALAEAARNSALNIDRTLDSILKDVESAGEDAADDDIPF